jgi:hypothetical protein
MGNRNPKFVYKIESKIRTRKGGEIFNTAAATNSKP